MSHIADFGLNYGTIEEFNFRHGVYADVDSFVNEMNAENIAAGKDFRVAHNKLSTMTNAEKKRLNGHVARSADETRVFETLPSSNASGVDWRGTAVTGVKDQGQCGSCWSFGSNGSLEGTWQISGQTLTSFAEQQLVDCAGIREGYQNMGCQGGNASWAYDYLKTHKI